MLQPKLLLLHVIVILLPLCFLIFSASASASCQDEHLCTGTQQYIQFYTCIGLPNITSTQNKNTNAVLLFFWRGLGKGFFRCDWLLWLCFGTWLHHRHLGWSDEDLWSWRWRWRICLWRGLWSSWRRSWCGHPHGRWRWRWYWWSRATCGMPITSEATLLPGQAGFQRLHPAKVFLVSLHQTPHKYKTCCNLRYKHRQYNTSKVQNTQKYKVLPRHEMGLHSSSM